MASPSSHSPVAQSVISTPPTSAQPSPEAVPTATKVLDDIFSSSPNNGHHSTTHMAPAEESLSDLPALRRQHVTAGYREGLSIAKAKTIQAGFDAGYPLGVELGLTVGRVFGILEAIIAATEKSGREPDKLKTLLVRAKRELTVPNFLEGVNDEDLGRDMATQQANDQATHDGIGTQHAPIFAKEKVEQLEEWEKVLEKMFTKQAL